jgi:hypothetical protein
MAFGNKYMKMTPVIFDSKYVRRQTLLVSRQEFGNLEEAER